MINVISGLLWRPVRPARPAEEDVEPIDNQATAPPENGVVKALRGAIPFIAAFDYLIITDIVVRLVMTLFIPATAEGTKTGLGLYVFEVVPTGGVIITAVIAIGLITARLASLESDQSDIATIKDEKAQKERRVFLQAQIKICSDQRVQSLLFMIAYVLLVASPVVFTWDTTDGWGRGIFLLLIVGEMLIPLLNMRTFTIVEASLIKIDVIRNTMYQAQLAALSMLQGISKRARKGALTRQDLASVRAGGVGNVHRMLQRHETTNVILLDGKTYQSLRSLITGKRDGDPLDEAQAKRYERALAVARRIRAPEDPEIKKHFTRGDHNQLFVTLEMSGQIANQLSHARTRKSRKSTVAAVVAPETPEGQGADNPTTTGEQPPINQP